MPRKTGSGPRLSETRLECVNRSISATCDESPQKLWFLQIIRKVVVFCSLSPNCRSFMQLTRSERMILLDEHLTDATVKRDGSLLGLC